MATSRYAAVRRWASRVVLAACLLALLVGLGVPLWYVAKGQRLLVVTSGSMEPGIKPGDAVVITQKGLDEQLRPGVVVTVAKPRSSSAQPESRSVLGRERTYLVTHRVVRVCTKLVGPNFGEPPTAGREPLTSRIGGQPASGPVLDRVYTNDCLDRLPGQQLITEKERQDLGLTQYVFLQTQGDNNSTPDVDLTPIANVRGIVIERLPRWGYLFAWLNSAQGRAVILGLPLLLLLGSEIASWRRPGLAKPSARAPAAAANGVTLREEDFDALQRLSEVERERETAQPGRTDKEAGGAAGRR